MVEFAETRRDILQIDYDFEDRIEYSVFVFDGETREFGSSNNDVGWGAVVDALFLNGRLNVGAGYISNLAESDEEYLREENNAFQNKVGAWNAYAVYEADNWAASSEILQATDSFREFERSVNKPKAWNLESAYFVNNDVEIALRYERSDELIDEAQEKYGIALTWHLANKVSFTAEYLRANYKKGFVEEDDDIFVTRGNTFAVWFAFEF